MILCGKCGPKVGPKENCLFTPAEVKRHLAGKSAYCRMCQKEGRDRSIVRTPVRGSSWRSNDRPQRKPKA